MQINMPFDPMVFNGGLRLLGQFMNGPRGTPVYGIKCHADLKPLLGERWYIRGVNPQAGFCYVNRDTVRFYLRAKVPIKDYLGDGQCSLVHGSFILVFKFVHMDGVRRELASVLSLE